ncbi:hypothetical protein Ddye_001168 [Dipteronia dyeriana]|uniref:SWIM-type domain-containing protein n=1 Tax=Dipteronia dyeriana TaxID=168575 RepID=A0AAD9XMZ6_9ROSI|nr:hypothetical protein Ddye_001168 [Dipteronia dyeriana]
MFEIEKMPYIPVPLAASSSEISNPHHRFMTDLNEVDFSGFEENIFDGDGGNDNIGENEHVGADGLSDQIDLGGDLGVDLDGDYGADLMPDDIGNNYLFEGYQSNSEDEFFSDSDDEGDDSKLAVVMKSNPFKKLIGAPIRFEIMQFRNGFKKIKNDKNRLTWACLAEKCPWRLHASIVGDDTTMQVKTYNNEHTCHRIYKSQEARSKWISSKFEVLVKNNPNIQCGVISNLLRDKFNVSVDPQRLNKAKKRALEVLLKDHTESFSYLRGKFIERCKPFIDIDGWHLKGPYEGVILSAVALDANSGLYPLAYCICEGETLLSWSWFLRQLRCFLKYPEDRPICFMSDMQKGVIGALKMYWPKASVRFCARHIYTNFSTKYSGQKMRKLFWKASKTDDKHEFKKCIQDIGSINSQAMAYLAAIEPCHWSRHAFDKLIKCDHVTNNMTEALNSMLKDFRARTYLGLMEYIRRMVMSRFQQRKEECSRWGNGIPPAVNKKIKDNSMECRILQTLYSGQGKYEMLGVNRAYTANLNDKTCECGQWQVSGVPCCHALAGIRHHFGVSGNQCSLEDYIDPLLSKATYLRTYDYMIHPIPDLCVWGDHVGASIQPPLVKRKPGRPKLPRKRESTEKPKATRSGSVVCGKCKLLGHNSRTCKAENSLVATKKASKIQPTVCEGEGAASSSKPSKKRHRVVAKEEDVGENSSHPTTQVQTQPISQLTQLN